MYSRSARRRRLGNRVDEAASAGRKVCQLLPLLLQVISRRRDDRDGDGVVVSAGPNIPLRKANPAFCDRSKSHKKLDPFDDGKNGWSTTTGESFLARGSLLRQWLGEHAYMYVS